MDSPIRVTPAAARYLVASLIEYADAEDAIRIVAASFGRNGVQHGIDFDPRVRKDDLVIDLPEGRKVLIDPRSAALMAGVVIDARPVLGDPEGRPGLCFRRQG